MATEGRGDDAARARAVDPARSFIVQAPAGSGKTSLLTLRFLRLLATVDCPEEIVAITFTRKAASEMRHRIVDALSLAARPLEPDAEPHRRALHAFASAALARSRARGWDLERNPARLHVQTIDGLSHWLAQRLPLAARIALSSALVDDARPLYREAGRRLVAALEADDGRSAPLERLARMLDHDPAQLAVLVADMLGSREVWLPKLMGEADRQRLRGSIDGLLKAALESELARLRESLAPQAPSGLFAVVREAASAGGAASPLAPLAGARGWPAADAGSVREWQAWVHLLLTTSAKEGAFRRKVDAGQGFLAASAGPPWRALKQRMLAELESLGAHVALAPMLARVRRLPPPALADAQWQRLEALLAVLPHAAAELVALFAERGSLDHAAVAAAARDALRDEAAPTDLALSLDYRIRHLLVDEYQDTSPAQERLLALLLAGWQRGDGRTLFCVGDPMQSIYGFREADVTLFLQAAREGIGPVALEALRLGRNFRSSRAIVDWVNATFASLLPAADDFERGAVRYAPAQAVHAAEAGDGVRVHALIDADERALGEAVARIAAEALAGAPAARPNIAVLVRGRRSLPPVIAALKRSGIDYRGIELESLADRAAIRDLVALAKAMLHPGDRAAWLAVLRAPWCGLTLGDLHALAADEAEASVAALMDDVARAARLSPEGRQRLARLRDALRAAGGDRGRRTLGGWVKCAWLMLAGPATVEDASDLANAELLFAALDRLEAEAGAWPEGSDLDELVEQIKASPVGRDDAPVQIMTIHKAKGLEFDVVIVPDMQRQPPPERRRLLYWTTIATGPGQRGIVLGSRSDADAEADAADPLERWMRALESERAELELGRVAYVAVTRARRALHLVGSAATRETNAGVGLQKPRAGSLLRFFWPALAGDFERALAARAAGDAAPGTGARPRLAAPPLRRLPAAWSGPEPAAPPRAAALRILGEASGSVRPDFDWAGTIAKAVGEVVHLELHRLARAGAPREALVQRPAAWARLLRESGVDEPHLPAALARTQAAIDALRTSALAGRLLDAGATGVASELALTVRLDGAVQGLRIDRTFVDEAGVRWIVDWKTSTHEGGDPDAFLDAELERYRGQLERYARAMREVESGRALRVGLYFPLLDAWREL